MDLIRTDSEGLELEPGRVERLRGRMTAAVAAGETPGISVAVARAGKAATFCAGRMARDAAAGAVTPETVFLVASVTKPVVGAAAALCVERGQLALDQPVAEVLTDFGNNGKEGVTLRHLLTHTSGLPDMLPENQALREQKQPLSEFMRRVCRLALLFQPGTRVQYQSMGTATVGALVEAADGRPLPRFLQEEFFAPLGMEASCLGFEDRLAAQVTESDVSIPGTGSDVAARDTDWGWNSDYWRRFGAPWGGMHSTPLDLCRFLQMFASGGRWGEVPILAPATVRASIRCQTDDMASLPDAERRRQAWGMGWRLQRGGAEFPFGDLASPGSFGHAGATGTMVWHDPATGLSAAIFTNRPLEQSKRLLHQVSNLIAAADR